jgi:hypothetical protein
MYWPNTKKEVNRFLFYVIKKPRAFKPRGVSIWCHSVKAFRNGKQQLTLIQDCYTRMEIQNDNYF